MLYAIDRALMESSRWFCWHEMVTAECRVLDVCDIFIVGSASSLTQGIKKKFWSFSIFEFFFFPSHPLNSRVPPFFNHRRGWAELHPSWTGRVPSGSGGFSLELDVFPWIKARRLIKTGARPALLVSYGLVMRFLNDADRRLSPRG